MADFKFVIRDGLSSDIDMCLALDHSFESDYVWKMSMQTLNEGYQATFRKERLPRQSIAYHEYDEMRLRLALPSEMCYLVAIGKDEPVVLGYLTMRPDPIHKIAMVQDIIVGQEFRHAGIGSRLLSIARQWASKRGAKQIMVEVPTINYSAIKFFQNRGLVFCGFNDQYFRNHDISVFFGQAIH
ncbi:MAG: GNAT family N-acetyltransferase [Chloroflexota bacterium]